jgi:hypothetical protein
MKRTTFLALAALLWLAAPRAHAATTYVHSGDNLQTALNNASAGDVLVLDAGASFTGPFTLPNKGSVTQYITITSSALSSLPGPTSRVSPSDASNMPKILAPSYYNALVTAASASYYQFIGVEFAPVNSSATIYDLILLGDGGSTAQTSLTQVPHHIRLDRCYIHGYSTGYAKRGVALHSAETSILNSHISDFHVEGQDAQGIAGWNGPGPFHIANNFVSASGQNIAFGGALPAITNLVPSDIEILHNYLFKPLSWKSDESGYAGTPWTVKCLLELKSGKRVVIDGNLMENQWDNWNGYAAVNFTVRNDSGSWATLQYITFRNNIVRHAAIGLNILGLDTVGTTVQSHDMLISNNIFDDVGGSRWQDDGMWMKLSSMNNLTLDHNTVLQTYDIIWVYGPACTGFVMTNNIAPHNSYGIIGASHGSGSDTISTYFPSSTIQRNVIPGASSGYPNYYPTNNYYPSALSNVGFVNQSGHDYNLASSSSYKGLATDGKDPGADQNAVETATGVLLTQP